MSRKTPTSSTGTDSSSLTGKGLATGRVGTLAGAVMGISSTAPGYTLTASIGLIVSAVGLKAPAIFIAGFIPMFLTAYAYRELNSRISDCGTAFTWSTKAFGPYVGWMCGWGMVLSNTLVISNQAAIAVDYLYLFAAQVLDNPDIADLSASKVINIGTTLTFLALATWISCRGITTSERLQYGLVGFQMVTLLVFATVAIVKSSHSPTGARFSLDWFNPFSGIPVAAFVVGTVGSIFAFWGWDTTLSLGEESKDPDKVPGRAGLLSVTSTLMTYLLVATAVMMYAGVGSDGIGLGNPANAENVFKPLANPVMDSTGGLLLFMAIFASSAASLQTTLLPAARSMLAMGSYGAFPRKFASVHPRYMSPVHATVVASIVTSILYVVVKLLSERALVDTVAALGIMICWYYGITSFACIWLFRFELLNSVRNVIFKLCCPLFGGMMMAAVFVISVRQSLNPDNASGASLFGIGLVFYIAFGLLVLGAVLMLVRSMVRPEFFRNKTFAHAASSAFDATLVSPRARPASTRDILASASCSESSGRPAA